MTQKKLDSYDGTLFGSGDNLAIYEKVLAAGNFRTDSWFSITLIPYLQITASIHRLVPATAYERFLRRDGQVKVLKAVGEYGSIMYAKHCNSRVYKSAETVKWAQGLTFGVDLKDKFNPKML